MKGKEMTMISNRHLLRFATLAGAAFLAGGLVGVPATALAFDDAESCKQAVRAMEQDLIKANVTPAQFTLVAVELEAIALLCDANPQSASPRLDAVKTQLAGFQQG